ncbi:MAG: CDP-alcohol phosphatidyltransferase family protein [Bacteroidales bacterium]|nr:CDP-alcohol phosphatidyltransferase family protein [Bacteroidales bacterium]
MRRHVPNLITLLNLACGSLAILLTFEGQWRWAVYLVLAASVFDFLDGLAARLLKAGSRTGKQLDSLADMISFGLLPGVFIYTLFKNLFLNLPAEAGPFYNSLQWVVLASVLLVPALSAIRLARFNTEADEGTFFFGLPTPAHTLFWTGIFWQFMQSGTIFGTPLNLFFMWTIMFIMAFHMILPVPMYSLKFEHMRLRGNLIRYLLLLLALLILIFTGWGGLSLVILVYILLSLLNLLLVRRVV